MIGFFFAWFALLLMLSSFYGGLVKATVSAVRGGTYQSNYLVYMHEFMPWAISAVVSSVCLAIGLRAEELE